MNILYFGSISSPYQISFWTECQKYAEIDNVYLSNKQPGHEWNVREESFVFTLNFEESKLHAFIKLISFLQSKDPDFVIIGGYKMPFSIFVILWFCFLGKKVFLWLEIPKPSSHLKNCI